MTREVLIQKIIQNKKEDRLYVRFCTKCRKLFRTKGKFSRICWTCLDKTHRGNIKYNGRI